MDRYHEMLRDKMHGSIPRTLCYMLRVFIPLCCNSNSVFDNQAEQVSCKFESRKTSTKKGSSHQNKSTDPHLLGRELLIQSLVRSVTSLLLTAAAVFNT